MSGAVDVLAVMDKCHSSLECGGLRHSLSEARAAVAELIEAAKRLESRGFFAPSSCADAETSSDMAAMRAALARVQAVQP